MNNFHVYGAIGHGKYSTVYKGRKKKTIEYFAVKSVDKSQRSKVLHEVRMLHTLNHPNVLKFYAWYETSSHLWLVLEYCVGGDLLTLLKQDRQLPEESVHELGFDLVKALQFLHSKGIIYGDLKPSNILLDENGHTKLCDFGLARRLSDISRTPSSQLPQAKRGTPCYMAPELFEDGGVHSYASDFWALGCVLYECYAGRPPFLGQQFTQLVNSITSDPTPPLPGTPSRPFANLVNSLLVKDPFERLKWSELAGHAFWRVEHPMVSLPSQPVFDSRILSERNEDRAAQTKTPTKGRERNHDTSAKNTPGSRKPQPKMTSRLGEEKSKEPSSANRRVNLLRMSRIAKVNLQKETAKENYRRPLPSSENDSEVKIENNDMELDFEENTEDEPQEELEGSDNTDHRSEEVETISNQEVSPSVNMAISDDCRSNEQESTLDNVDAATSTPSSRPQLKAPRTRGIGSGVEFDSSKSSNVSHVLWHISDLSVRPVMPSRKADKISDVIPSLSFEALQPSEFLKMSKEQLDSLSNRIISILNSNASIGEKQNVIRYLEILSNNAEAANILTNGPIMLVLVKMLRLSKASALRVQLASVIGLLIRHSTFIDDDLAHSGILGSLTDGLRDKQEKVRRFSMAALGELLFYISTQNEQGKESIPLESPSKDNRSTSGWQVPSSLISLVSSVLRKGEDDITQLYALRTIENVCSQGGNWAARFTSQDVISNLCYIYRASGKQESMRLTAGSCLVRVARFNPPSIQSIVEKLSLKDIASALVKGSPREQQISLNLLDMALLGSHLFTNIGRQLSPLAEDKNLVPNVVSLIEQGTEVLRGKALILMGLLCKNGRRWLPLFFCNARVIPAMDRLAKEKETYLHQCIDALVHIVVSIVPSLLDAITGDIQQMMGGKRHGLISAIANRVAPKTSINLFPVVLHLLGSSLLKSKLANHQVLQQLANLIKIVETPFQGRDDFQITLLRVLESVVEESSVILECCNIFIGGILPSLIALYKGNKDGDARFQCLKILFDVMVIILNEPSEDPERLEALTSISNTHFLPLYPAFIEDEDPIPMYAQKLLVMLIEFDYIKISDILHPKTVSQCFEFLLGDLTSANVNNVKLCLALASAPEIEYKLLSQLKVVRKIGNLLEFVSAKGMEDFLEPTLGLCRAFLVKSVGRKRGLGYKKLPALLNDSSSEVNIAVGQEQCIRDIVDFGSYTGVFLELSAYSEVHVSDIASECVVLLLKAAPREAITGFLTNLAKVGTILESWHKGVPNILLQRMLHALGYSCRQYSSQALILSISAPEITRIEAVVSELKKSNTSDLANAALLVASELQRLPRRG